MRWRKVRDGFLGGEKKGEIGKWEEEREGRKEKIGESEKIGRREERARCDTEKSDIIHTLSDSQ